MTNTRPGKNILCKPTPTCNACNVITTCMCIESGLTHSLTTSQTNLSNHSLPYHLYPIDTSWSHSHHEAWEHKILYCTRLPPPRWSEDRPHWFWLCMCVEVMISGDTLADMSQTTSNFGLIDRSYEGDEQFDSTRQKTQWERFANEVHRLNKAGNGKTQYKLFFMGRHGEGYVLV